MEIIEKFVNKFRLDRFAKDCALDIVDEFDPDVMFLHLSLVDSTRHGYGIRHPEVDKAFDQCAQWLIEVLEQCTSAERLQLIDKLSQCATDDAAVEYIQNIVEVTGGLSLAARTMQTYITRASSILAKYADSPYRTSLINMCAFVAERDR